MTDIERPASSQVDGVKGGIAVVGPLLPYRGGIAHYNSQLLRAFAGSECRASFYSFARQYPQWLYPGGSDRDPEKRPHEEANVHYAIDSVNPVSWYRTVLRIAADEPSLVVVHWWTYFWAPCFLSMIALLKRRGVRVAMICHNVADHDSGGIRAAVSRLVIGMADAYLVHSQEHAELLAARWPNKQVAFHPIPPYESYPKARGLLRKRGRLELLFFGFIRPYKGLDVLMDALDMLSDDGVYLSVVGEHWGNPAALREYLSRRPNVEARLEYTSDLEAAEHFHRADYVVLPYKTPTPSAVASVAYHYDKPIIASRVRGLEEMVLEGRTGILVQPNSASALAVALRQTTRDEASRLSIGVREHKLQHRWQTLCVVLAELA